MEEHRGHRGPAASGSQAGGLGRRCEAGASGPQTALWLRNLLAASDTGAFSLYRCFHSSWRVAPSYLMLALVSCGPKCPRSGVLLSHPSPSARIRGLCFLLGPGPGGCEDTVGDRGWNAPEKGRS